MKIRQGARGEWKPVEIKHWPGMMSLKSNKTVEVLFETDAERVALAADLIAQLPSGELSKNPKLVALARMTLSLVASEGGAR